MNLALIKPHRGWMSLLAGGLLILTLGPALMHSQFTAAARRAADLKTEQARLDEVALRLDEDTRMAANRDIVLSADDISHLLEPANRLQSMGALERQAAARHLTHFTYTLAPERKAKAVIVSTDDLTESGLDLAADAPLDTDAYQFINNLHDILPGRLHLRHLILSRINPDAPLSAANIHMEANMEWLSNTTAHEKGRAP